MVKLPSPAISDEVHPPSGTVEDFEFSDPRSFACYLCSRGRKSLDQLKRHNVESDLHKKNLKDGALRDIARDKAASARQKAAAVEPHRYRDRALERRAMHNQPDAPQADATADVKKKRTEALPAPPPPPPAPLAPGKDENNIGNKLLKKMGWTDGAGLGTEGDGRVDPVQTAMFEMGVGIGAAKAKEITQLGSGYGGYVAAVKDSAKSRYNDN